MSLTKTVVVELASQVVSLLDDLREAEEGEPSRQGERSLARVLPRLVLIESLPPGTLSLAAVSSGSRAHAMPVVPEIFSMLDVEIRPTREDGYFPEPYVSSGLSSNGVILDTNLESAEKGKWTGRLARCEERVRRIFYDLSIETTWAWQ